MLHLLPCSAKAIRVHLGSVAVTGGQASTVNVPTSWQNFMNQSNVGITQTLWTTNNYNAITIRYNNRSYCDFYPAMNVDNYSGVEIVFTIFCTESGVYREYELYWDVTTNSGGSNKKDGEEFYYAWNGVEMQFKVISANYKTCMVNKFADSKTKSIETLFVPEIASGYRVTEIDDAAFAECNRIEKIFIPEGITKIGKNAFQNCDGLTFFTVKNAVTYIGDGAFSMCDNLEEVTLGSALEELGFQIFWGCDKLKSVTSLSPIPPKVSFYGLGEKLESNATLYVPAGSLERYRNATGWKAFRKIEEIGDSQSNTFVSNIVLNKKSLSLETGQNETLTATISPDNATDKSLTWSSSKTSVATVSSSGLVTTVAEGTATITCKANDGSGVSETCQVTVTSPIVAEINATNFPDANFRNWLLTESYGRDGILTENEINEITEIYIYNGGISSLKGIEYFTNLAIFQCYDNQLTYVDISKNTKLEQLILTRNKLEELDVSKNIALWRIACGWNQLTTLDLRNNINLKELSCNVNFIKGADMDALINSLPSRTLDGTNLLKVIRPLEADEHNVCTKRQVASAKAKGWTVKYWDGTQNLDYEGSDEALSIKGDVNGDGQVNGTDYVALTNIVLGKNTKTDAADVNGDGEVNGTDYVALVNIVLGRSQAPRRAASDAARLSIDPSFDIKAGETKEMVINLTNPNDEITLVQFDLRLPDGLAWEGDVDIPGRTTWRKHSLEANATGGIIRFLLASSSNATLSGTEGGIITITVTADKDFSGGDIKLENILMVSPDEKETKQDTYTYTIGQTSPTPSASAVLAIEPFNIAAGGEAEMVIDLTNPSDEITLVQFDLRLPDGLSVKQTGGEYVYDIADRTTWRKHSLEANATGGIIRFLLASSSNATLSGTEGGIITITVTADKDFSGGDIKLENILMVSPDEKETKQDTYTYTIGQTSPTPSASAVLAIEPFNIAAGGEAEMVIDLTNPSDEITLVQFDLRLPDGLSVKQTGGDYVYDITDRTTWRKHSLEANATGGIIRFLLASSSNATLSGTEGAIITMTLKADNTYKGGTVKLENILLVTPDEKEIKPADLSYNIGSTGISSITMDAIDSNTPIYNLRGQRLAAPQKGINIIGGKKVIVK